MEKYKFIVQRDLFSLDVIKKVFYQFRKSYSGEIRLIDETEVEVVFHLPDGMNLNEKSELTSTFQHELVDQSLRERITDETEFVRNLILANAFSNAPIGN